MNDQDKENVALGTTMILNCASDQVHRNINNQTDQLTQAWTTLIGVKLDDLETMVTKKIDDIIV